MIRLIRHLSRRSNRLSPLPHILPNMGIPRIFRRVHRRFVFRASRALVVARFTRLPGSRIDLAALAVRDLAVVARAAGSRAVDDVRAGEFLAHGFVDAGFGGWRSVSGVTLAGGNMQIALETGVEW